MEKECVLQTLHLT